MRKGVYLLLGSNLGDREKNLLLAIKKINEQTGNVISLSSVYKTQPWGNVDQPDFLNQVIEIETSASPASLLSQLQAIEKDLGKKSVGRWGPREIDIDILFFGNEIIREADLVIPHPGIPSRRFTLLPICEIAAGFVHPELKLTCRQLLDSCPDTLKVEPFTPGSS